MYQVLYRKWRPKTFDDVIGQEHITKILRNEIETNKISHAYLFTGVRGTGKTTCAKILSKAINCLNPQNGNPCGECSACREIENSNAMDVVEIDAASNNGVENIRNIIEETAFNPANLKYRVYIIDEVHMLSIGAFNAFLKTLEEPLEYVVFILATTEIHKIPATILSRCQRFDFNRISIDDIAKRVTYVSEQEGVKIEKKAADLIAKLSSGAMRDALSILDQCIMNAKKDEVNTESLLTEEVVNDTVGNISDKDTIAIMKDILNKDAQNALQKLDGMYRASKDMSRLSHELCDWLRNVMIVKSVKHPKQILDLSDDEIQTLVNISKHSELNDIIFALDTIKDTINYNNATSNSRTNLELAIIKACKLHSREVTVVKESTVKDAEKNKSKNENLSTVIIDSATEKIIKDAKPMKQWNEVVELMQKKSRSMATAFKNSKAFVSGDYLLIDAENELAFVLLRESKNKNEVRELISKVTGKRYKLGPYKKNIKAKNNADPLDEFEKKVKEMGVEIIED